MNLSFVNSILFSITIYPFAEIFKYSIIEQLMTSKSNRHQQLKTILISVKQEVKEIFNSQNMTNHPLYYQQLTIFLFKAIKYTTQFLQLINSDEQIGCTIDEIVRRLNQSYQQYKSQNVFASSVIQFNQKEDKTEDDEIYHFMNTRNNGLPVDCISTYENDKQRKELLQFVQQLQHKKTILNKQSKRSLIVPKSNIKMQRKATFDPLITSYQDKKVQSLKVSSEDILEYQKDQEHLTADNKQCFSIKESLIQSQSNISQSKSKMTQIMANPVEQLMTKTIITQAVLISKIEVAEDIMKRNSKLTNVTKRSKSKKGKVKNKQQIKNTNENTCKVKNTKSLNEQPIKISNLDQPRFKSEDCSLKLIKTFKNINDKSHTMTMIKNIKLQSQVLQMSMSSLLYDDQVIGINIINVKKQSQVHKYVIKNQSQGSSVHIHQINCHSSVSASGNQPQYSILTKGISFEDKSDQLQRQKISNSKQQVLHTNQKIQISLRDKSNGAITRDKTYKDDKMLRYSVNKWQGSDAVIHINPSQKENNKQDITSSNQVQNIEIISSLIPKKVLKSKISLLNFKNSKQQQSAKAQQVSLKYKNQVNQSDSQHSSHLKSRMNKIHQTSSLNNSINMWNKQGNNSNGRKSYKRQPKESVLKVIDKQMINKISRDLINSNGDKYAIINSNQILKNEQKGLSVLNVKASYTHHQPLSQINESKRTNQMGSFLKYPSNNFNLKKMQMHSRAHKSVQELSFHQQQMQENTLNHHNRCDESFNKNHLKYANYGNNQTNLMENLPSNQSYMYNKLYNHLSSNNTSSFHPHQKIQTSNMRSFYNKKSSPELRRSNQMFELSTQFRMRNRRQKMKDYLQLIEMAHNKFCGEKCVHVMNLFKKQGGAEQKLSEQLVRVMMMEK